MTIYTLFFSLVFIIYLNLGFIVLYSDWQSRLNLDFFIVCMMFAAWTFCHIFTFSDLGAGTKEFWTRLNYVPYSIFPIYTLKFFLRISGLFERKWIKRSFYWFVWIVPVLVIYQSLVHNAIARGFPLGFWFNLSFYSCLLYNLTSITAVVFWGVRSKSKREKSQALFISISAIVAILVSSIADYYSGFSGEFPSLAPLTVLIWVICIVYIMAKYRFLRLTPSFIGKEIIDSIDDVVYLIDNNENIIFSNPPGLDLLENRQLSLESLSELIVDYDSFKKKLETVRKNDSEMVFNRLIINTRDGQIALDIRMKSITDNHDDMLGIMMIGKQVWGISQLRDDYGLTSRQTEIIFYLMSGITNSEIGEKLQIAETTVKGHVTNIYNKLGLSNRYELQNVLYQYNINIEKKPHQN